MSALSRGGREVTETAMLFGLAVFKVGGESQASVVMGDRAQAYTLRAWNLSVSSPGPQMGLIWK